MPGPMTPAQKEQIARQNGFKNYEQMMLWTAQRQNPTGGVRIQGSTAGMPTTVQGAAQQATAWHPSRVFNYITEALRGATNPQR